MSFFNLFNSRLAGTYQVTDQKPDKTFSILPTVLRLAGNVERKIVGDLGCGSGFFTLPLAERGAKRVIGIDNSEAQLTLGKKYAPVRVEFRQDDVFTCELPAVDVYTVPFVANYLSTVAGLNHFMSRIYNALSRDGRAIFVVDLPDMFNHIPYKRRRRLGAVKWWAQTPHRDESMICNHLFDGRGRKICSLWAYYFSPPTIQGALQSAGFKNIQWHRPDISAEGRQLYGQEFWKDYPEHPELGYVTAEK